MNECDQSKLAVASRAAISHRSQMRPTKNSVMANATKLRAMLVQYGSPLKAVKGNGRASQRGCVNACTRSMGFHVRPYPLSVLLTVRKVMNASSLTQAVLATAIEKRPSTKTQR